MEINQTWIDQQRAVCEAATPGPWESNEPYSPMVTAKNPYGHDLMHIADIRGWGQLTGKGGCALKEEKACEIQAANSAFIAAARTALPAALDALEAFVQREDEKDATIARLAAERDAAVSDMLVLVKSHCVCDVCKHGRDNGEDRVPCEYEKWCSQQLWEWRGLCSDNTDAPTGVESEGEHA